MSDLSKRRLKTWIRLLGVTRGAENHLRDYLRRAHATTLPRFDLMAQLERNPGGLKMKELSHRLMVTGGNITGIVDQLVTEKLVERLPEPGDRRAFRVRLTRAGDRLYCSAID